MSEIIDMRKFRATVRNEFMQMKRVKAVKNLDPVAFLDACEQWVTISNASAG